MDPQQTWKMLIDAFRAEHWLDVIELAQSLTDWLNRGGFPPQTSPEQALGTAWHRHVAGSAAAFAVEHARKQLAHPVGIAAVVECWLVCIRCQHDGPKTHAEATDTGWRQIQQSGEADGPNFIGVCPRCCKER